jgi:hypothetical protein
MRMKGGEATEGNGTYYHSVKQIARSAGMCCACDSKGRYRCCFKLSRTCEG